VTASQHPEKHSDLDDATDALDTVRLVDRYEQHHDEHDRGREERPAGTDGRGGPQPGGSDTVEAAGK
jgi:hypothetical protein